MKKGSPFPLGVTNLNGDIQFAISLPHINKCKLNLYRKGEKNKEKSIQLDATYQIGSIFSVILEQFPYQEYEYMYEVNGIEYMDPYAKHITGREKWGQRKTIYESRCGFDFSIYEWHDDIKPNIPYEDSVLYQLHVRGFTKHVSSKVENRGTFEGIIEKIPYLKELGITGIILMPSYEFNECMLLETKGQAESLPYLEYMYHEQDLLGKKKGKNTLRIQKDYKINYWGYSTESSYFAPKMSYASQIDQPSRSLKDLIKAFHKNHMEVIMELYFHPKTNRAMILECLRYWVLEYHIDGFHLNEDRVPLALVATDPILCTTKLFTTYWNVGEIFGQDGVQAKYLGEYNDGFMIDIRRFLKGDEGMVQPFIERFKRNPSQHGVINYISKMNGFTAYDMVSYDVKHNDNNGENGQDGTDYNYSWNCGVEGKTKRKTVLELRKQQIKNAMLMLFLSQGTPMLLSGDEFLHSANGNNNPYCQDNNISWINWNQLITNQEMYDYIKNIIAIRKEYKVFHQKQELQQMDYLSCGYPDFSIHGTKAWNLDYSNYNRTLGILLSGEYVVTDQKERYFVYLVFNMHWENHIFDLPILPEGLQWELYLHTSNYLKTGFMKSDDLGNQKNNKKKRKKYNSTQREEKNQKKLKIGQQCLVGAREIVLFFSKLK